MRLKVYKRYLQVDGHQLYYLWLWSYEVVSEKIEVRNCDYVVHLCLPVNLPAYFTESTNGPGYPVSVNLYQASSGFFSRQYYSLAQLEVNTTSAKLEQSYGLIDYLDSDPYAHLLN